MTDELDPGAAHRARATGEGKGTMSKLVRTLMLGAMLVVMNLAAATAVAQEQTTTDDAVGLFRASERASAAHPEIGTTPAQATQPARAAGPSGRPGLLVTIGVLAAATAAATVRSATRRVRARQAV
jgi:hypothetical protein